MTANQIVLAAEMDGTPIDREQAEELSRLDACKLLDVDGKLRLCINRQGLDILARDSTDQTKAKALLEFVDNIGEWN